ncbi:MAG: hypothetical protein WA728_05855, partial [Xanthobacteraceae bacterium]
NIFSAASDARLPANRFGFGSIALWVRWGRQLLTKLRLGDLKARLKSQQQHQRKHHRAKPIVGGGPSPLLALTASVAHPAAHLRRLFVGRLASLGEPAMLCNPFFGFRSGSEFSKKVRGLVWPRHFYTPITRVRNRRYHDGVHRFLPSGQSRSGVLISGRGLPWPRPKS